MKYFRIICIIFLTILITSAGIIDQRKHVKSARKNSFRIGEKLTYRLHYGPLTGGNAVLSLDEKTFSRKKVFHAKAYAKTTGLTNALFPIEDCYESYFDMKTCLPYIAIRKIKEGGYKYYTEDFFEHSDSTVFNKKHGKKKIPAHTFDMISSLYYLRNLETDTLKKGDVLNFTTYFDDEIFPFDLRYRGKEMVSTRFGKIRCLRFDPIVEPGRIFRTKDDMSFWVTDDQNLIPVLVKFDLIVGSVKCELIDYANLNNTIHWN